MRIAFLCPVRPPASFPLSVSGGQGRKEEGSRRHTGILFWRNRSGGREGRKEVQSFLFTMADYLVLKESSKCRSSELSHSMIFQCSRVVISLGKMPFREVHGIAIKDD